MKKTPLRQAAMKLALVACVLLAPLGLRAQETLTVYDGAVTNIYVPMYGGYFDDFTKSEFVIPASELEEMVGGEISSIKFYIQSVGSYGSGWSGTHQQVFLKEVGSTTLSAYSGTEDATIVFDGMFDEPAAGDQEFEIVFSTNYTYQGGNLLIGIYNTVDGGYRTVTWYGQTVNGASGSGYNGSALSSVTFSQKNFIPKTTFTYEPAQQGGDVCEKPTTCDVSNLTATSATLTWGGGSGRYNVELKAGSADWATVLSGTTLTTTTLTLQPTTTYQARVQSVCDGTTPTSGWKTSTSFTTPCASYDIPYTYGFEDAAPFACWTVLSGNITRINGTPNTGSYRLDFRGTTSNMIALPQFNEATNHLRVEFWTRPESTGGSSGKFAIGYMTDIADASSFVAVETYNSTEMTTTYVKKTVDMVGVPANAIIAMRQFDCSTNYYWYVDDVTVKEIPSCVAPTGLAANPSTTSAELSWTANSGETAWTLYYKKAADANYTEVTNATNPYTLQGLQAATSYLYYVVANCAAEDASEPSEPFAFATACDVIPAVGYSENFDGYTTGNNVLPLCWNFINTTTYSYYQGYPKVYNSSANSPSNCLYLYSYAYYSGGNTTYDPQPQYAILPEMSNLAGKFVTLWAKGYNATSTFKIGTMTDPADAGTFAAINEQALTTSYQEFEYVIPANAEGHYLAIMIDAASSSRTSNGAYIDDIRITEVPTCRKPSALMLETPSARTAHTATLKWTNGEVGQEAWQIAYSTDANFDPDTVTPVDVTENPATISGLAQSTTYYAYVRANCGNVDGVSAWNSTKATFTTRAGNVTPTGLAVDNATITSEQATVNWNAVAGNELHTSYDIYWAPSTVNAVPDVPAAPNLISGITETSQVITGLEAETQYKVWVRDNCGTDGYSNWSNPPYSFQTASACETPDGLAASSVTTSSATISWNTYGQSTFNLRYSTDGTNWTTENNVNSPYTIDGTLSSNTAYQVQVQPTCADAEAWSATLNFRTECDAITIDENNLYTEDFNSYIGNSDVSTSTSVPGNYPGHLMPSCWKFFNMSNTSSSYPQVFLSSSSGYIVSGNCLFFKSSSTTPLYARLPEFSNNISDLKLTFTYRNEGASTSNGTLVVGYMTDPNDANTFDTVLVCEQITTLTEQVVFFPNAPAGSYIAFKYQGGSSNNYYLSIDSVVVEPAPTCYPLGTLTHANVGTHSVDLSWALVDDHQSAWVVEYADNDEFNNVQHADATTNTNFALNNLTPETHYWVRVKADCGNGDYGEVSNVVDFTTGIACQKPTDLAYSELEQTSARLSWTENGTASNWVVAYMAEGDADFTEVNAGTNPYYLGSETPLTQGTNYTVKVRANCSGIDGMSQWSDPVNFQTVASCPAPTNLTVTDASETPHGATITWSGNGENDSYTVEYAEGPLTAPTTLLNEDFESGNMPTGWTTDGPGTWSVGTGDNSTGTGAGHGTYNARITHNTKTYVTKLITPEIDLSGVTSPTLSYMHIQRKWSSDQDELRVYYRTSSSESWTLLAGQEYTAEVATWTTENNIALPNPSSTYQIAFEMTDGYGYGVGVDNVVVTAEYTPSYSWNTLEEDVTSPYVINNLEPETQYVVRVKGVCGSTPSPASNIVGFTTGIACYAPENFAVDNSTVTHNSVELSWTATGGTSAWVVAYKADGDANFTEVENVTENAPYRLEGLDPETQYTVKVKSDCGGEGYSSWSEEKTFTTIEACAAPTAFVLGNVAAHQATFSWTAGNGNTAWKVYVKEHGAAEYPAAYTNANTASATISGLEAATAFDVKIVPTCDENKILEVANAFTTLCEAVTTFPWIEDFNSLTVANTIPVCWNNEEGTTTTASYKWCYTTSTNNGGCNGTGHNNTNCVRFNSYNNYEDETNFLKSPVLSLPAGQPLQLKFWYKNPAGGDFSVYISTDGGATHETALATGLTGAYSWTEHDAIDLSAYAGQDVVIVFKGTSNYGSGDAYIYLDDVTVAYTVEKAVEGNKWYAISSPVHNSGDDQTLAGVTNLTTSGAYDLYGYTETTGFWTKPTTALTTGKGYIYRRSTAATLSFIGLPNTGDRLLTITSQCPDGNIAGFNLVGNPFPHAISRTDYYTLQPNGSWLAHDAGNIGEAEAFLVYTNLSSTDYEINDVTPSKKSAPAANPAITFTVSNGEFRDVAYARFDNSAVLPKIGHLEPNAPALSIPVNGKQYAIANLDSDCESFVMNFSGMGDYTISASGEVAYLHLIDKVTGSDIDLLSQPTYSFKANMGDLSSRFLVKLVPNGKGITDGDFAFRNGNGWTVEGEGTLEAYDAMGRLLFAQEISSSSYQLSTSHFPSAGVYILRLGGNSQKIVVTK